jgi:hypothetical protein
MARHGHVRTITYHTYKIIVVSPSRQLLVPKSVRDQMIMNSKMDVCGGNGGILIYWVKT